MKLPTLIELGKATCHFLRYQDGQLWYSAVMEDGSFFHFPVPTDTPALYEKVAEVRDALKIYNGDAPSFSGFLETCYHELDESLMLAKLEGATGGEFLPVMKGLALLRWSRRHLAFVKKSSENPFPDQDLR